MATESRVRSILKAISWRIIATSTTFLLAFFVFSSADCEDVFKKSSIVAALEVVLKVIIYYFHERAWVKLAPDETIEQLIHPKK